MKSGDTGDKKNEGKKMNFQWFRLVRETIWSRRESWSYRLFWWGTNQI